MIKASRLKKLISETKMVGRFYVSAVLHPANYPELENILDLSGLFGLRVACCLTYKQEFLFHISQLHRLSDDDSDPVICQQH